MVEERDVRIPARRSACSVYAPSAGAVAPEAFGKILGENAVREVSQKDGWLSIAFTDAFYDACVSCVLESLPRQEDDMGRLTLNRMLALARQGGADCPRIDSVQRALWLLLGAAYGHTSVNEAVRAWERMLYALPVKARMEARRACGALADACARLYARALLTAAQKT